MKKLIIITCCLIFVFYAKASFVLHTFAENTDLTNTESKQSQKSTKGIIDFLQYNKYNKEREDYYTDKISLLTREIFEKSVARQLKEKNKLTDFSFMDVNDTNLLNTFTRDNVGIFINAFIEAVDFCIPTNKRTGLKDLTIADHYCPVKICKSNSFGF